MSSIIPACNVTNLPVTIEVSVHSVPRGHRKPVLLLTKTEVTETRHIMQPANKIGKVRVGHHTRVSDVYGAYSSHEVHVSVEFPVSMDELDNFEDIADAMQVRCVLMVRRVFNQVLESVGKTPLFTLPVTSDAVTGAPTASEGVYGDA